MGTGKLREAAAYVLGVDFRIPGKDEPEPPPIICDHTDAIQTVWRWWKTESWPLPGGLQEQAIKVRFLANIVVSATQMAERGDRLRMELIVRALGNF